MTATVRLALVPRDGLFCKDGRGWHTSASGRGHALDWPWPSTILGAVRSAWGRREEARAGCLFDARDWRTRTATIRVGRSLALRRTPGAPWRFEHTVWPVPEDALCLKDQDRVNRLDPQPPDVPTLGRDNDDAREALWRPRLPQAGKPLARPRWWNAEDFVAWLSGKRVAARRDESALAPERRMQSHVGIRSDELTADEGVLFSHDVIETLEPHAEWAIGVEVELPDGAPSGGVATLGSDSRLAYIESLPQALFEPPEPLLEAFQSTSRGLRVVAVTPLCFERGWLPDGFVANGKEYRGRLPGLDAELILRAAFVPRPIHVSGWDMAAGAPKPTSRMVAPGAVYFFERTDGKPFGELDARSLWLAAIGARTEEGFGHVAPGLWMPSTLRQN
jgi:CRISPR-associated protein Cmr3